MPLSQGIVPETSGGAMPRPYRRILLTMDYLQPLQIIWDYLGMHQTPTKADCIVGFGNFNTDIARRAAELYHQGYAPKILFTGGLGRNTKSLFPEPEAVKFARVAVECGVPEQDIILEDNPPIPRKISISCGKSLKSRESPTIIFWAFISPLWSGGSALHWVSTGRSSILR